MQRRVPIRDSLPIDGQPRKRCAGPAIPVGDDMKLEGSKPRWLKGAECWNGGRRSRSGAPKRFNCFPVGSKNGNRTSTRRGSGPEVGKAVSVRALLWILELGMGIQNVEIKDSLVACQSSQGGEIRGSLLRLTRFAVVFETYNPASALRLSEVLSEFRIVVQDRTLYSGRAVVGSLVNAGLTVVCEATLDEGSWMDVAVTPDATRNGTLREQFKGFMHEWQKLYRVGSDYKLIVADMQSFFMDLRLWLDQVELSIRSSPSADRLLLERELAEESALPVIDSMNALFEEFEAVASRIEEPLKPAHRSYMRRQLHAWVLCAPFAHRAFYKPLGYAGDYELVNMMARNLPEGASLFAKVVNTWFVRQPPAQAHRNRIRYLVEQLVNETVRANAAGRDARIFNVACGPAQEVQQFLVEQPVCARTQITLLDFNQETLEYSRNALNDKMARHGRSVPLQFVRKSVQNILKESGRTIERSAQHQYDLVYCAGLFDYLSGQVCQRLMNIMYTWLAPGGLLIATNVEPANPLRHGMEHLLDWHLIYRTAPQLRALKPQGADADSVCVRCDDTGVNLFIEVRKPSHAV
jgi:extracellular factor (EF) 3-hydroxypalmitic acid methyl ester biosynthesis protein